MRLKFQSVPCTIVLEDLKQHASHTFFLYGTFAQFAFMGKSSMNIPLNIFFCVPQKMGLERYEGE